MVTALNATVLRFPVPVLGTLVRSGLVTKAIKQACANNPHHAYCYALVTKKRFFRGEPAIMRGADHTCWQYTDLIVKGPWDGAVGFKENVKAATQYARFYLKQRFYEAEPYIVTDAMYSFHYFKDVVCDVWPEAEAILATDKYYGQLYLECLDYLKKRPHNKDLFSAFPKPWDAKGKKNRKPTKKGYLYE